MLNLESCQKCYISRNILWNPPRELQFKVVCKALTRHVVKIDVEKLHLISSLLSLGHFMGWILCDIYLCPFQSLWVILFTGQIRDQIFVVNISRIGKRKFLQKERKAWSDPFERYKRKRLRFIVFLQGYANFLFADDQIREKPPSAESY